MKAVAAYVLLATTMVASGESLAYRPALDFMRG